MALPFDFFDDDDKSPKPCPVSARLKAAREKTARQSSVFDSTEQSGDFWRVDGYNAIFLTSLYFIQGIVQGLVTGSLPFLFKRASSYSQVATLSIAGYPFSTKLLWSPVVDGVFSKDVGRRKTWIIPTQIITGFILLWSSPHMMGWIENPETGTVPLTVTCFLMFLMSATGDIAVDGWALTMLSRKNRSYASTCQTIGVNSGYFISFTVLLAFSSADFADQVRSLTPTMMVPLLKWWDGGAVAFGQPLISLSSYLRFFAFVYLFTVPFIFLQSEGSPKTSLERDSDNQEEGDDDIVDDPVTIYKQLWSIINLKAMKRLIAFLAVVKIPFAFQRAVVMQLLDRGFPEQYLAGLALLQFPFEIIFAVLAGRWSRGDKPLGAWFNAYVWRIIFTFGMVPLVFFYPAHSSEVSMWYFGTVVAISLFNSFASCIVFTAGCSFYSRIADPAVGGTYLTLVTTLDNLGGMATATAVLYLIDLLTIESSEALSSFTSHWLGAPIVSINGFYIIVALCALLSFIVVPFIRNQVAFFNQTHDYDWQVKPAEKDRPTSSKEN